MVGAFGCEVPIQKVGRDIELVVAVCRDLVLAWSNKPYAVLTHQVLTHQKAIASTSHIQTIFFQFFGHSWRTIAAKAET